MKTQGPHSFIHELYQTLGRNNTNLIQSFSKNREDFTTHFINIALPDTQRKDITRKKTTEHPS